MTKTLTDGNGTTHFFDVYPAKRTRHVNDVIGKAMLFIPIGTSMVEQVPMLIYYHGHNKQASIERYVKAQKERDFRPLLASKKVLLVQPWGGHYSNFGALQTAAGVSALIDQAMFIALTYGPPVRPMPPLGTPTPKPQSLIIAGFSGGGHPLNSVVIDSKGDYLNRLTEAWSFDSMYWAEGQKWVNWAHGSGNSGKKLRVRLSTGEDSGKPRAQAEIIRKAIKGAPAGNIDIDQPITSTHEELPGRFIPGWL
jgi:hypothetical protein